MRLTKPVRWVRSLQALRSAGAQEISMVLMSQLLYECPDEEAASCP
jgi:hypothetical protein